jgi:hypothetical protein
MGKNTLLAQNNLQRFLSDFPNATKKDALVKTSPVSQSALAEPGTALNMASPLVNISLESQEDDTFIERALGKKYYYGLFW